MKILSIFMYWLWADCMEGWFCQTDHRYCTEYWCTAEVLMLVSCPVAIMQCIKWVVLICLMNGKKWWICWVFFLQWTNSSIAKKDSQIHHFLPFTVARKWSTHCFTTSSRDHSHGNNVWLVFWYWVLKFS